jgi:hypothetical protein
MAQRKKGKAAQRRKTATPRKTRGRVAASRATTRSSAKARPQKRPAKAKAKRVVAKVITPKKAVLQKHPKAPPIEVVRVEQVAEPAPGVVVVSQYESVQAGPTQVTAVPDEPK